MARELPTARELAPFHRVHELIELKRLATELDDPEAIALLEATITERKKLDLEHAITLPAQAREHQIREAQRLADWELKNRIAAGDGLRLLGASAPVQAAAPPLPSE